jgi:PAS domain S-box-containing protein
MKYGNLTREDLAVELGEAHKLILELKNQISALKKLIGSMRENEEKFQLLFSLTNDVMFSYDLNLKVLSVSDNVERLIGFKPEELVGKYFYDLAILHPEDLSDALEDSLSALTGKVVDYNIQRFITKDGKIKFGELSRIPLKRSGKTIELICVARDISERIEREKIISESRETARVLLDVSNDTSLILDTSGNVIAINEPAAKRFGKTVKELLGANIFKEMPEMTAAQSKEAIDEVIATGKPIELVAIPAGRPLAIRLYPIRDARGKVARIAANARSLPKE